MRHVALLKLIALGLAVSATAKAAEASPPIRPRAEDYTMLWWAEGPPYYLGHKEPPASEMLCVQSGTWGAAFDTKLIRVLRFGNWPGAMLLDQAVQPGRAALADLPAAAWDCAVVAAGRRYACVGRQPPKGEFFQPVRFIETGRFFQRVVIEGLKFADDQGRELACNARLEISAWPDRLALRLELEPTAPPPDGTVGLRVADRRAAAPLAAKTALRLVVIGDDARPAVAIEADPALKVGHDVALDCHTIDLPEQPWSNAQGTYYAVEHLDRLDRWKLTLRNSGDQPATARLMFRQNKFLPITGLTPMLCQSDGTPTGLPVQLSKNWHQRPDKGQLEHQGPWFHGFALAPLPPRAERTLLFQLVYARYGGVLAASHAQLCLVGWGHNQFWDQAAIGSFGESICFEPGRVQRRCFIDDVRPLMTLPHDKRAKPWGWAENCGGGDFWMWQDAEGRYRPMRATRTNYRAHGPCLTDVGYTEESAGGEVAARMDVSVPRSADHLRTFLHLRYDVRQPITWRRLAFFQLGADFYNNTPSRRVAVGDVDGVRNEWTPPLAKDVFDHPGVPLAGPQPWLSVHGLDRQQLRPGVAAASRGLIVRRWSAVLGGQPARLPHASFFCTEWGKDNHRTVAELAPPPGITRLQPGDFVEADLELVVFPADAQAYYGPDHEFQEAVARDGDTWRLVQREAAGNALQCEARRGNLLHPYPLRVAVDGQQTAEVTLRGGLGYVPLTFMGLTSPAGYALNVDDRPVDQTIHGNDFWQTDCDPPTGLWRQTYNVRFDAGRTHTVRFARRP